MNMENRKNENEKGLTVVEIMLVLAIVFIVAGLVFRVLYAKELMEWESNLWRAIGVEPALGRFIVGVSVIFVWISTAIKNKRKRRRNQLLK